ncbi:MAG: hypothetical protein Q9219_006610 [cf. Caloplaca sp. 3 TL-2023]
MGGEKFSALSSYRPFWKSANPFASPESGCGSVPTVTVTVTAPHIVEHAISAASTPVTLPLSGTASGSAEATITLSSTSFSTSTKVISVTDAPMPVPTQDDNYYFAEDDGTTTWLGGKTPTSGAVLVTNTVVLTIQPQPVTETSAAEPSLASEDETTTGYTTISTTSLYTEYLTKALTLHTTPTLAPSGNLPSYLGPYGWNSTLSTMQSQATGHQPSDIYTDASMTVYSFATVYPSASIAFKRHHPRQIGAVVTATIDGVIVSWTNVWGGPSSTSNPVTSIGASSVAQALTAVSTSENAASETSVESSYLWDSAPVPLTTSSTTEPEGNASPTFIWVTPPSGPPFPFWSVELPTGSPIPLSTSSLQFSTGAQSSSGLGTPTATASPSFNANESSSTQYITQTSSSTVSLVGSIPPFPNATQTSASASSTASSCGNDTGRFTVDFDDLPHFSTASPLSDIPPIFNPYRKLFFNGGYGYVPPPSDPYAPISPPQLAVYNYHNDSVSQQLIDGGFELHGEIGAGPRANESAYWIDAYSTWIGCANAGPGDCQINFLGYDQFNTHIASQTVIQPPCPELVNCKLAQVTFTNQFRDLAGLQILAFVNKTPITFYMDDLNLGWSNNSCAAQVERASGEWGN